MHYNSADENPLKEWITKRLESISNADTDVLADYVLALLRSEDSEIQVKTDCTDQLEQFLAENTAPFVKELFETTKWRLYIAGNKPPSQIKPQQPSQLSQGNLNTSAPQPRGLQRPNGRPSRKRRYNDPDAPVEQSAQNSIRAGRATKQMRYGPPDNHLFGGMGATDIQPPFLQQQTSHARGAHSMRSGPHYHRTSAMHSPPPAFPSFDPNNPMANMMGMPHMGMPPFPPQYFPQFAEQASPPPNGGPFPQTPFGYNPMVPGMASPHFFFLSQSNPLVAGNARAFVFPLIPISTAQANETQGYPPDNAAVANAGMDNGNFGLPRQRHHAGRGGSKRGRGDRTSGGSPRHGRAIFSSTGAHVDPQNTRIVVENIPDSHLSESKVREFFVTFGQIEDVKMEEHKHLAIVTFADHASAKKAHESPNVVFENRFVKVYWFKPESQGNRQHAAGFSGSEAIKSHPGAESEPAFDPEQFAKKQEAAQRAFEEKQSKRVEADKAREELDQRVKKSAEDRRSLLQKMAGKPGSAAKDGLSGSDGMTDDTKVKEEDGDVKTNLQTDALRLKLAELEAEAESLGISAEEKAAGTNGHASSSSPFRGFAPRGRGRGSRGAWRGAFSSAPRGRGGWFAARGGRGGAAMGGSSVARLDNRPKNVAVTVVQGDDGASIDFTGPEKDAMMESLSTFLMVSLRIPL